MLRSMVPAIHKAVLIFILIFWSVISLLFPSLSGLMRYKVRTATFISGSLAPPSIMFISDSIKKLILRFFIGVCFGCGWVQLLYEKFEEFTVTQQVNPDQFMQ